jgi:hypothetical protein
MCGKERVATTTIGPLSSWEMTSVPPDRLFGSKRRRGVRRMGINFPRVKIASSYELEEESEERREVSGGGKRFLDLSIANLARILLRSKENKTHAFHF